MIVEAEKIDWYDYLSKKGLVPQQKKNRRKSQGKDRILNVYSAFDIETSTLWLSEKKSDYNVHSFMYVWQFQIEDMTIKGRTWAEFFIFLSLLQDAITKIKQENTCDKVWLIIWVHNLAYEFSFLSGLYPFKNEECFFRSERKPIYCRMFDCFDMRCSYIQTNLSLSALCKQCGVEQKLSGQKYDYDKLRFPWTELTDFEEEYGTRDVESLVNAMRYRIQRGGDTLVTVPLTSTGYVRRECKQALADQYLYLRDLKPKEQEYRLLRMAFRGGNTHANRYYVGKIIDNVYSYDISSSYPTQQLTRKFPSKPFKWIPLDTEDSRHRMQQVFTFIGLGYAVVGNYQFKNLRLKNINEPMPYVSLSRCKSRGFVLDNGRILECDYIEIALTEIDLEIILDQYEFDFIDCLIAMTAQKDYLPQAYREVILDYYRKKTALKGDDTEEGKYLYMKSKNMLNSVYGMSATDPIHQEIKYNGGEYNRSSYEEMTPDEILKKLKSAAFPYQWGVYTTAYARQQLQDAIKLAGKKLIYCDTDSIKTEGPVKIEKLNDPLKAAAIKMGAFADDMNGSRHYIGLFESDGHYDQFITQGAKRYAFMQGDKMGITVSGVQSQLINEKTGVAFAVEELQDLKRFKPGMVWRKAGGTMAVYNDVDNFTYTDPKTGNEIQITKNVAIIPSTYKMSYARDYEALLNGEIKLYGVYQKERE